MREFAAGFAAVASAARQMSASFAAVGNAVGEVVRALPGSVDRWLTDLDRFSLLVGSSGTEWLPVLADALRRNDSLPLLVYADWLEERNEHRKAATVRRLAERMTR